MPAIGASGVQQVFRVGPLKTVHKCTVHAMKLVFAEKWSLTEYSTAASKEQRDMTVMLSINQLDLCTPRVSYSMIRSFFDRPVDHPRIRPYQS